MRGRARPGPPPVRAASTYFATALSRESCSCPPVLHAVGARTIAHRPRGISLLPALEEPTSWLHGPSRLDGPRPVRLRVSTVGRPHRGTRALVSCRSMRPGALALLASGRRREGPAFADEA